MKNLVLPITTWALLASGGAVTMAGSSYTFHAGNTLVDNDVQQTVPIALATVNPCNSDAVALTGETHILIHTTDSQGGSIHGYTSLNSRLSGVGTPSGVSYQGSDDLLDDFTIGDNSAIVETLFQDMDLQSQTGEDNYHVRLHIKITVNANGLPTADVLDFDSTCNG